MTEYEAYQEHIRYTHDTYCRIVIRHASFDAARMLAARWRREISLEYLTEEKFVPLSTTDEYFQVPDYGETYLFSVRGQTIFLDSCSLAAALAGLPEQTQEEIFLYYFQHLTQKEIGEQSGWTRSTIGRHIQLALKRLKEEIVFVRTHGVRLDFQLRRRIGNRKPVNVQANHNLTFFRGELVQIGLDSLPHQFGFYCRFQGFLPDGIYVFNGFGSIFIGTFHLLNLLQMADIGQPAVLQHRGQIRGKLRGQCGILTINPIFIGILFSGHIYLQNFEFH